MLLELYSRMFAALTIVLAVFLTGGDCVLSSSYHPVNATINEDSSTKEIPDLVDGVVCEEGKRYKKDCNTCRCGKNNVLKCTRKACVENKLKNAGEKSYGKVSAEKKKQLDLPELPSGLCEEGKFYKKGCRRCYCEYYKKAVCTDGPVGPKCKLEIKLYRDATPDDYGVRTNTIDITQLPDLPNLSTKCDPGHTYRVDCNICICLANKNLLCTSNYCLSLDDMNKVEAKKLTGAPCTLNDKDDPCVRCSCVEEKLKCEAVKNCTSNTRRRLHGPVESLQYPQSLKKGQDCVPGSMYKVQCNRCYCQSDGALRCTAMTCLNYVQASSLQSSEFD